MIDGSGKSLPADEGLKMVGGGKGLPVFIPPSPLPLPHKGRGELILFNIFVKLTICKITKIFL
jgi:hypothetical protein